MASRSRHTQLTLGQGQTALLAAELVGAEAQPEWDWSIDPSHGGTLTSDGPGRVVFIPGFLLESESFIVRTVSKSTTADAQDVRIEVRTRGAMDQVLGSLLPPLLGHKVFAPRMELLAGRLGEYGSVLGEGKVAWIALNVWTPR